jgi:hypothetical protein
MRFYSFVPALYLNSLQSGLQTGHTIAESALSNMPMHVEWAEKHKTIIILDAINLKGLKRVRSLLSVLIPLYNSFEEDSRKIPLSWFHEDEDSLGRMMTCVGAVIPEHIYDGEFDLSGPDGKALRPHQIVDGFEATIAEGRNWTKYGVELLIHCLLKSYNLAPR